MDAISSVPTRRYVRLPGSNADKCAKVHGSVHAVNERVQRVCVHADLDLAAGGLCGELAESCRVARTDVVTFHKTKVGMHVFHPRAMFNR